MISLDEVISLSKNWFHSVQFGSPAEQSNHFININPVIYLTYSGAYFTLEEHDEFHKVWTNEKHVFGDFNITQLSSNPERARAVGTVYWEATHINDPTHIVKATVSENWIVERLESGELKFVLYMADSFHLLPDSAAISL